MGKTKKDRIPDKAPKVRKVTSGPLRDKARTMASMVAAVGKVLQKKGYAGLNAAAIVQECGVDKRLVSTYFGGLDNLVEAFIRQRDFWKTAEKNHIAEMLQGPGAIGPAEINELLQGQLEVLLKDRVLQRIIHWELAGKNKLLRKIADQREEIGELLLARIEPAFKGSGVNIRAVLALLVGGIYYLSLHGKSNGSLFCGLDINKEKGKKQISETILYLIELIYQQAEQDHPGQSKVTND